MKPTLELGGKCRRKFNNSKNVSEKMKTVILKKKESINISRNLIEKKWGNFTKKKSRYCRGDWWGCGRRLVMWGNWFWVQPATCIRGIRRNGVSCQIKRGMEFKEVQEVRVQPSQVHRREVCQALEIRIWRQQLLLRILRTVALLALGRQLNPELDPLIPPPVNTV